MIIERIINILRGQDSFVIDKNITKYQLFILLGQRGVQFLRGIIKRISSISSGSLFVGKGVKISFKKNLSIGKGVIIGDYCKIYALSKGGINIDDNVTLSDHVTLIGTGVVRNIGFGISIGKGSAIGHGSYLGGQGGIQIGQNVIMGPYVKIFSENHIYSNISVPIKKQGETRIGVKIDDDCWIGSGVTILDGVRIEEGTVVAAGAIVTKSPGKGRVVLGGVPARILKNR